jgi:hypothetical protein
MVETIALIADLENNLAIKYPVLLQELYPTENKKNPNDDFPCRLVGMSALQTMASYNY